jgi:DNA-binding XRE family transcriptional regulator
LVEVVRVVLGKVGDGVGPHCARACPEKRTRTAKLQYRAREAWRLGMLALGFSQLAIIVLVAPVMMLLRPLARTRPHSSAAPRLHGRRWFHHHTSGRVETLAFVNCQCDVRELRNAKGWTPEELGEAAGMNELQVGHIERGATDPKLSTIRKLARAYGMTVSELLRPLR